MQQPREGKAAPGPHKHERRFSSWFLLIILVCTAFIFIFYNLKQGDIFHQYDRPLLKKIEISDTEIWRSNITTQLPLTEEMTRSTSANTTGKKENNGTFSRMLHLVVVNLPLVYINMTKRDGYQDVDLNQLLDRQNEMNECVRRNSEHWFVKDIHILTDHENSTRQRLQISNQNDIHIVQASMNPTYADILRYVSATLVGELVMVLNGDNYLGEGFQHLQVSDMRANKKMYTLTRHRLPLSNQYNCSGVSDENSNCNDGTEYVACHDSFLFFLESKIPDELFPLISYPSMAWGGENRLISWFRDKLGYTVTNPCKVLYTYHLHCVKAVSTSKHDQIEWGVLSRGTAGFTNLL